MSLLWRFRDFFFWVATSCDRLVHWLWWGETDVSDCGLLRAFVHPRVNFSVEHEWWYWLSLTPNLSTRALWQPPVLSGAPVSRNISVAVSSTGWFPVNRDISGSYQYCLVSYHMRRLWRVWKVGEENENLVYASPWDFKCYFTCRKILWDLWLYFPSERNVCCGFYHH
jgi:hypothetical protein